MESYLKKDAWTQTEEPSLLFDRARDIVNNFHLIENHWNRVERQNRSLSLGCWLGILVTSIFLMRHGR